MFPPVTTLNPKEPLNRMLGFLKEPLNRSFENYLYYNYLENDCLPRFGKDALSCHNLTAEALAAMIGEAVTDQNMHRKAAALGQCIESKDGARKAMEIIQFYLHE